MSQHPPVYRRPNCYLDAGRRRALVLRHLATNMGEWPVWHLCGRLAHELGVSPRTIGNDLHVLHGAGHVAYAYHVTSRDPNRRLRYAQWRPTA